MRQHRLAAGEDVRAVGKRADGAGGHHHVPHAQRWHDGFAEGAHKDHPVMLVEAFQRRQHFAGVVKFAVIIIFDNPRLVLAGPVEQLLLARQRERDRQRALVRRGDDGEAGIVMITQQVVRIHPCAIDRHGVQAGHNALEQLLAHKVARILKYHLIAAAGERVEDQAQAAAVAAGDHYLFRSAG